MGRVIQEFKEHPVHENLESKLKELKNSYQDENYNDDEKESILAYQLLLGNIKVVLSSKSAQLSPPKNLDSLNSAIQSLHKSYYINISNYGNYFNNIWTYLRAIPYFEKKSQVKESFNQLIENFVKKQNSIKEQIEQEIQNFQGQQEKEFTTWESKKREFEGKIDDLEDKNISIGNKIDEFNETIKTFTQKLDETIEEFERDFEEKQAENEKQFNEKLEQYKTQFGDLEASFQSKANRVLSEMNKKKDEVEKLWGIIGKSATVGSASKHADDARDFANKMMWIAITIMFLVVFVLAITTVVDLISGKFDYLHFIYKVLASTIVLAPALYCANISKTQRDREFQLRDFEVKTATLEPFMESMTMEATEDNEEKDKVKLELTKSFFDKEFSNTNKHNDSVIVPKEIVKILQSVAKNLNLSLDFGSNNEKGNK